MILSTLTHVLTGNIVINYIKRDTIKEQIMKNEQIPMLRFLFNQPSFWSLSLPEQNSGDK